MKLTHGKNLPVRKAPKPRRRPRTEKDHFSVPTKQDLDEVGNTGRHSEPPMPWPNTAFHIRKILLAASYRFRRKRGKRRSLLVRSKQ